MLLRATLEVIGCLILGGAAVWFGQPWVAAFKRRQKKYDDESNKGI